MKQVSWPILAALACQKAADDPTDAGVDAKICESFFGNKDQPLEIVAGVRSSTGAFVELSANDAADLIRPVQGGHCMFIAAQLRNLCASDDVELGAKLFTIDGELRSGPFRVTTPLVPDPQDETWLIPDMATNTANTPNLCACPNNWSDPIVDTQMRLDVSIVDSTGREGTTSLTIVPACRQDVQECQELCECECGAKGGVLGACPAPGPETGATCETVLGASDGGTN